MLAFVSNAPLIPEVPELSKGMVEGAHHPQAEETKATNLAAGDEAILWHSLEASKASSVQSQPITCAEVSKEVSDSQAGVDYLGVRMGKWPSPGTGDDGVRVQGKVLQESKIQGGPLPKFSK